MDKKSLTHFLVKHYRVLFRSSLIEGFVFLLLFLIGLARYRFALVFIMRGLLSAVNQYYTDKESDAKIIKYLPIINSGLIGLVLISVVMDFSKGQIYPKHPNLPIWLTVISVGLGYGFALLLHVKIGSLFQKISGNAVFTVCPTCGYANIKVVEKCGNCGHEKGMPLVWHEKERKEIPEELQQESNQYKKMGLYRKVPQEVIISLKLVEDEYILIAMKSPFKFIGGRKDNATLPAGWLIMTNRRIICYSGFKGWVRKEEILYSEIEEINIVPKQVLTVTRKSLEIKTVKHLFLFLIGFSRADKILKGFWLDDISNNATIMQLLDCIKKRNPNIY